MKRINFTPMYFIDDGIYEPSLINFKGDGGGPSLINFKGGGGGPSPEYEAMLKRQNEEARKQELEAAKAERDRALNEAERSSRRGKAYLTQGGGMGEDLEDDQILKDYMGV